MRNKYDVVVVGGGAAGMIAAIMTSKRGLSTLLIEKNEKLGKKIYITGKGRCNVTNECDVSEFMDSIFEGHDFAYSALYTFDQYALIKLLEEGGTKTKTERGNRVFPVSEKASDITKALEKLLKKYNAEVILNTNVSEILVDNSTIKGVITDNGKIIAKSVILACGGESYPSTGSDGSGYTLAKNVGHKIVQTRPALVSLSSKDSWVHKLSGLSLVNVNVSLYEDNRLISQKFGELLFTHKGVSGPTILSLSCLINKFKQSYVLIDTKPALDADTLEKRLLRDFDEQKNKDFKNSLDKLLPKSLAQVIIQMSNIPPTKKINQITTEERKALVKLIKNIKVNITSTGSFEEAIITRGGIELRQINPSTMESKIVKNLYLTGEMIALHGFTGGYNLQLAFSTGNLAGISVECEE